MFGILNLIIASGFLAILYGYITGKQVISASPGNKKMQEIAGAIQEGARAYLNRQYKTIAIVGVIIFVIITFALGLWVGLGFFIGSTLSGVAGYVGMIISVQANVRTAEASRKGLSNGLSELGTEIRPQDLLCNITTYSIPSPSTFLPVITPSQFPFIYCIGIS